MYLNAEIDSYDEWPVWLSNNSQQQCQHDLESKYECIMLISEYSNDFQLQRYESEQGYQNDWMPGYQYQYDEDDYHFQPQTVTIMPTKRKYLSIFANFS